jgi:hypothetical protein
MMVFEVIGQLPNFKRNVVKTKAEKSKSFLGKEYVGIISKADVDIIEIVASKVPVDNETVEWDCQDYVLEDLICWRMSLFWRRTMKITVKREAF